LTHERALFFGGVDRGVAISENMLERREVKKATKVRFYLKIQDDIKRKEMKYAKSNKKQ